MPEAGNEKWNDPLNPINDPTTGGFPYEHQQITLPRCLVVWSRIGGLVVVGGGFLFYRGSNPIPNHSKARGENQENHRKIATVQRKSFVTPVYLVVGAPSKWRFGAPCAKVRGSNPIPNQCKPPIRGFLKGEHPTHGKAQCIAKWLGGSGDHLALRASW